LFTVKQPSPSLNPINQVKKLLDGTMCLGRYALCFLSNKVKLKLSVVEVRLFTALNVIGSFILLVKDLAINKYIMYKMKYSLNISFEKRCWYKIGSPPPAASKNDVLKFLSVKTIVIAKFLS
jgi:hypothetical protein